MRKYVEKLAAEQATDNEIEAALAVLEEPPMTREEIVLSQQVRLAARANLRVAIGELARDEPQIAVARDLLDDVLKRVRVKLEEDAYTSTELVRVGKWLSSMVMSPRASTISMAMELGRQYLGFTARGYDDVLRTEAEKAEMIATAEREEQRRKDLENAH